MQKKEELLSFDEPLRFIFSHSALVEGWDNPNVFTICNLQDGRSEMRKRQQIGRGLRLPVMSDGERCLVDDVNLLTVIANEDFSKFAGDLQKEIEAETGVSFEGRISNLKTDKIKLQLKEAVLSDPIFQKLWERISRKTTYELRFETDDVVAEAVRRINAMEPLESVKFRVAKVEVDMKSEGVVAGDSRDRGTVEVEGAQRLPDVVGELTRRVALSRATIVRILKTIDNLDQVKVNPAVFVDRVSDAINQALYDQAAEGIVYTPSGDDRWTAELFKSAHQDETVAKPEFVVSVQKSITDKIVCDSRHRGEAGPSTSRSGTTSRCSSSSRDGSSSRRRLATTTPTGRSFARKTPATTSTSCARARARTSSRSSSGRPRVGRSSSARRTSTR